MRRSITALALLFSVLAARTLPAAAAQQAEANRYELRGAVINSGTGEGISGALVEGYFPDRRVQFSGSDGSFVFEDIPRGRYSIAARKPGFFNQAELGQWNAGFKSMRTVPADAEVIVKLTPEAIIYGDVTNEDGAAVERITVKAERWQTEDGRSQLEVAGNTATDDQGNFRIAELRPGTYYLRFESVNRGGRRNYFELQRNNAKEQGYGTEFYPGVADRASASAIAVRAGAQVHVTQIMSKLRLFEISGIIHGAGPESGVNLNLNNEEGDMAQSSVHFDAKTGEFQMPGIPPGMYVLSATAWSQRGNGVQSQRETSSALLPIHVHSDISGLNLTLGPGISVRVVVHDERSHGETTINGNLVFVRMISKEFPQITQAVSAPSPERLGRGPAKFSGLMPEVYSVEATTNQWGYVAALQCGEVNLLRDDMIVGAGTAPPPIEATLRDDGAQLNLTVAENGEPVAANVVVFSEEKPKASLLIRTNETGQVSTGSVAPGTYEVIALENAEDLEFRNPAAMQKYLGQASTVTLGPGDKVSVKVEVQKEGGQQ